MRELKIYLNIVGYIELKFQSNWKLKMFYCGIFIYETLCAICTTQKTLKTPMVETVKIVPYRAKHHIFDI